MTQETTSIANEVKEQVETAAQPKTIYIDMTHVLTLANQYIASGRLQEASALLNDFNNTEDIQRSYLRVPEEMARDLANRTRNFKNEGAITTLIMNIRWPDPADYNAADVAAALETLISEYRFNPGELAEQIGRNL